MFTSAWQSEGKSSICANVAVAAAQLNNEVILVDADLRQRGTTALLGLEGSDGLAESLTSSTEPKLLRTAVDRLRIVAAGVAGERSPADLLSSPYFISVIRQLRSQADVVVIDTPALHNCKDAHLIGPAVDGCYLVVHAEKFIGTPEGHLVEDLRDSGVQIVGSILNASREAQGYYYDHQRSSGWTPPWRRRG